MTHHHSIGRHLYETRPVVAGPIIQWDSLEEWVQRHWQEHAERYGRGLEPPSEGRMTEEQLDEYREALGEGTHAYVFLRPLLAEIRAARASEAALRAENDEARSALENYSGGSDSGRSLADMAKLLILVESALSDEVDALRPDAEAYRAILATEDADAVPALGCRCHAIIGTDSTRHFKECPLREGFPHASTDPCEACGGTGRQKLAEVRHDAQPRAEVARSAAPVGRMTEALLARFDRENNEKNRFLSRNEVNELLTELRASRASEAALRAEVDELEKRLDLYDDHQRKYEEWLCNDGYEEALGRAVHAQDETEPLAWESLHESERQNYCRNALAVRRAVLAGQVSDAGLDAHNKAMRDAIPPFAPGTYTDPCPTSLEVLAMWATGEVDSDREDIQARDRMRVRKAIAWHHRELARLAARVEEVLPTKTADLAFDTIMRQLAVARIDTDEAIRSISKGQVDANERLAALEEGVKLPSRFREPGGWKTFEQWAGECLETLAAAKGAGK